MKAFLNLTLLFSLLSPAAYSEVVATEEANPGHQVAQAQKKSATTYCTKDRSTVIEVDASYSGTEEEVVQKMEVPAQADVTILKFKSEVPRPIEPLHLRGKAANSMRGIYFDFSWNNYELWLNAPASRGPPVSLRIDGVGGEILDLEECKREFTSV